MVSPLDAEFSGEVSPADPALAAAAAPDGSVVAAALPPVLAALRVAVEDRRTASAAVALT